jgi:D-threonate/D-erythronate kinase
MRVLIIADDLTGALDSAVALAGRGLACFVARRPGDVAAALACRPDVLAVSTASREGSAGAARAAVAAAVAAVGPLPEIVFKKVDSRLKGHVADEVAVLAAGSGRVRALVAPAVPAQGRVVVGGRLCGTGVAAPVDVAAALGATGLGLDVPDARTDADLDAALSRAVEGPPLLLVGAAGLAGAVGRHLAPGAAPSRPRLAGPLLLAIGSRDPITLAQVAAIEGRADLGLTLAPGGACPPLANGVAAQVVRLVAAEGRAFDPRADGERFATGIAQLVRTGGFRSLLACGGETADAILRALGAGIFEVQGEILPGVPVSSIVDGDRKLQLVTKSGGFGDDRALARVVDAMEPGSWESQK